MDVKARREMTLEELKLKWEMCLEKIDEQEGEIVVLERELNRTQSALTLISEGLNVLHTMGTMARPSEFEILFKDYAPFNNIMAHYFPKEKKARTKKTPNAELRGAKPIGEASLSNDVLGNGG